MPCVMYRNYLLTATPPPPVLPKTVLTIFWFKSSVECNDNRKVSH